MKKLLTAAAMIGLAACSPEGGDPETVTHAQRCTQLTAGDADTVEEFARDGFSPDDFCACYDSQVGQLPEAAQAKHAAVFDAIIKIRKTNSIGVEPAAEVLEDQLRSDANPHDFSEDDFESVGKFLNKTGNLLEEGEACEAA